MQDDTARSRAYLPTLTQLVDAVVEYVCWVLDISRGERKTLV